MLSDDASAPAWHSLVPMQPRGSGRPLFCVHGLGGDVYDFLDLAGELTGHRRVYGLLAVGFDGRQPRHTSVEQMAAHYAREIRTLQAEGPYHLIGHSVGGWIAYAVAQELTRQGTSMGMLGLLDTRENCVLPWNLRVRERFHNVAKRIQRHRVRAAGSSPSNRNSYLADRWKNTCSRLANAWQPQPASSAKTKPTFEHKLDDPANDYFVQVAARYRPAHYSGEVDIFLGEDAAGNEPAFWKRLVLGRVHVHRVPGNHLTLINKCHAKDFVQVLKPVLDAAEIRAR